MKILKFYSNTCTPCKLLEKNLQETGIEYTSICIDNELEEASKYGIRSVPTLIMLDDNNKVIKKRVGMMTVQQIIDWYKNN